MNDLDLSTWDVIEISGKKKFFVLCLCKILTGYQNHFANTG
jgi:hypothetical protein